MEGAGELGPQRWRAAQQGDGHPAQVVRHRLDAQHVLRRQIEQPPVDQERARLLDRAARLGQQLPGRDGGRGDVVEHRAQQLVVRTRPSHTGEATRPAGRRDLHHLRTGLVQRGPRPVLDALRVHGRADGQAQRPVDVLGTDAPVESPFIDELIDERSERLEPLRRVLPRVTCRVDLEPRSLRVRRQAIAHQRDGAGQPLLEQGERRCGHAGQQPAGLLEHRGDLAGPVHGRGGPTPALVAVTLTVGGPRSVVAQQVEDPAGRQPDRDGRVERQGGPYLELGAAPAHRIEQQVEVRIELAHLTPAPRRQRTHLQPDRGLEVAERAGPGLQGTEGQVRQIAVAALEPHPGRLDGFVVPHMIEQTLRERPDPLRGGLHDALPTVPDATAPQSGTFGPERPAPTVRPVFDRHDRPAEHMTHRATLLGVLPHAARSHIAATGTSRIPRTPCRAAHTFRENL